MLRLFYFFSFFFRSWRRNVKILERLFQSPISKRGKICLKFVYQHPLNSFGRKIFFCYYLVLKVGDRYKNDISLLQGLSANCQKNSFQKLKKEILCISELKLRTFTQFSGSLVDNYIVCARWLLK